MNISPEILIPLGLAHLGVGLINIFAGKRLLGAFLVLVAVAILAAA